MENIQLTIEEEYFFKNFYDDEPDSWINPHFLEKRNFRPTEDWLNQEPHLNHKFKNRRGAVCLCVWEKFGKVTNRALVDYFKLIIPEVDLPLDVSSGMAVIDGRHRLLAYRELDKLCPIYINRNRVKFGYCWRPGVVYNDGKINLTIKNKLGYYNLKDAYKS
jgi:hypothetical protein